MALPTRSTARSEMLLPSVAKLSAENESPMRIIARSENELPSSTQSDRERYSVDDTRPRPTTDSFPEEILVNCRSDTELPQLK